MKPQLHELVAERRRRVRDRAPGVGLGKMIGKMALRAVLIDIDGTLVDSNGAHAQTWHDVLAEYGYRASVATIRRLIGMGGDKILPRIDPSLSDDTEPGKTIARKRRERFLEQCVPILSPQRGARALLLRFGLARLQRVAATSAKRNELGPLLRTAGVADLFDDALTSDDAQRSKPDPDIVRGALRRCGLAPSEAIYLGDTPYDVEAARRAGVACVALRCGGWSDSDLRDAIAVYADPMDLCDRWNGSPFAEQKFTAR